MFLYATQLQKALGGSISLRTRSVDNARDNLGEAQPIVDRRELVANTTEEHPSNLHLDFAIKKNGDVFVQDAKKGVYRLSTDLLTIEEQLQDKHSQPLSTVLTRDESSLVVFWSNGSTLAYPGKDISLSFGNETNPAESVDLAFAGENGDVFQLLKRIDRHPGYRTFRKLTADGMELHKEYDIPVDVDANGFTRNWVYGFQHRHSQYLVVGDRNDGYNEVRVVRLCGGVGGGWYEVNLTCGMQYSYTAYSHSLLNATYVQQRAYLNESAMLVISVRSDGNDPETRVCSYSLDDIDAMMNGVLKTCKAKATEGTWASPVVWKYGTGTCNTAMISACKLKWEPIPGIFSGPEMLNVPGDLHSEPLLVLNHIPSSLMASWNQYGNISLFIGELSGLVKEYVSGVGIAQREWEVTGYVSQMKVDISGWVLYVLSSFKDTQITRFGLTECSQYSSCQTCTEQGGEQCGWCTSSGVCVAVSQCETDGQDEWITDGGFCFGEVSIATTELSVKHEVHGVAQSRSVNLGSHEAVLKFLSTLGIRPNVKFFLASVATVLMSDENLHFTLPSPGKGGVWQLSEEAFNRTRAHFGSGKFAGKFNVTWSSVKYSDLDNPMYSALAAVMYIRTLDQRLSRRLKDQASFFERHFVPALSDGVCEGSDIGSASKCSQNEYICRICRVTNPKMCTVHCS